MEEKKLQQRQLNYAVFMIASVTVNVGVLQIA
jgi:hypothetical protein